MMLGTMIIFLIWYVLIYHRRTKENAKLSLGRVKLSHNIHIV